MTANVELLRHWLRERCGFNGVIVSDYHAIAELMRTVLPGTWPRRRRLRSRREWISI